MQIFRYESNAMRVRAIFLCIIVAVFAIPLSLLVYISPSVEDLWWQEFLVYFVWLLVWAVAWYDLVLMRIVQSATLTLDANSIGYHDCYLKATIAWRDVLELTPTRLLGSNGRIIAFRPGLRFMERRDEFVEAIVMHAGLTIDPRSAVTAQVWRRVATPST